MDEKLVCVDANIIVALVTFEVHSEKALALWSRWMREDFQVKAPFLLKCEVASALRRKAARGILSPEDARRCLEEALSLDIDYLDPPDLPLLAFDIATRFGLSTAYDAYYLGLAEILGCELWTADEELFNAVREGFDKIKLLKDFDPAAG